MIDTAVTLSVYPEDDYYYDVTVSHEELVVYVRKHSSTLQQTVTTQQLNFGTIEEMRAVATAMKNACSVKEQMK